MFLPIEFFSKLVAENKIKMSTVSAVSNIALQMHTHIYYVSDYSLYCITLFINLTG